MSVITVLATIDALLQDPTAGLAAKIQTLSSAASPPTLNFVHWKNARAMQPGTASNVTLQPVMWQPELKRFANLRDAVAQLSVSFESFQSDPEVLEADITTAAVALAQVLDGVRVYSDAHGGTIIDLVDPIGYAFGQFPGGTSAGFTATFSLEEQSTT